MNKELCKHCGGKIAIRNPKGNCDHLYYPDNCEVCKSPAPKVSDCLIELGVNELGENTQNIQGHKFNGNRCKNCNLSVSDKWIKKNITDKVVISLDVKSGEVEYYPDKVSEDKKLTLYFVEEAMYGDMVGTHAGGRIEIHESDKEYHTEEIRFILPIEIYQRFKN